MDDSGGMKPFNNPEEKLRFLFTTQDCMNMALVANADPDTGENNSMSRLNRPGIKIYGPPPTYCDCCGKKWNGPHDEGCVKGPQCYCTFAERCKTCRKCAEHCSCPKEELTS